jgi:hypothetical protein
MKVQLTFYDNESLSVEEVVRQATTNYGKNVKVDVGPESTMAYDHIYFGLQQLLTHEQLSAFFSKDGDYSAQVQKLRVGVQAKVQEIVDQVIIDNESRVT